MHNSPHTKQFFDELKFLTFSERRRWLETPEDSDFLERSKKLYDQTFVEGEWVMNINDAALVTMLCSSTSMIQHNWDEAVVLSDRWLKHPEIEKADATTLGSFLGDRAKCHFMKGDFETFLSDFKSSLDFPDNVFGVRGLNSLMVIYGEMAPEEGQAVNQFLKQAAILTAEKLKPGKRIASQIETCETDSELYEVLNSWITKIAAKSWRAKIAEEVKADSPDDEVSDPTAGG